MTTQPHSVYAMTFVAYEKAMEGDKFSRENILKCVANFFDATLSEIKSKDRKEVLIIARRMYCKACKQFTDCSLREIGEVIGARDHTTVLHSLKKWKDDIFNSPYLVHLYENVVAAINREELPYPELRYIQRRALSSWEQTKLKRRVSGEPEPKPKKKPLPAIVLQINEPEPPKIERIKDIGKGYSYNRENFYREADSV